MWDSIIASPYLNLVFGVTTTIGVVLAIVFYLKGRRIKRLTCAKRSFSLITNSVSGLSDFAATYKGKRLANLTATKFLIWSTGTEVVSKDDIASADPIRVILPEGASAVDAKVSVMSSPANLVSVEIGPKQPNVIALTFDYFGPKEGCLISILHTGGPEDSFAIGGTIKGHGRPIAHSGNRLPGSDRIHSFLFIASIGAILGAMNVVMWIRGSTGFALFVALMAIALIAAMIGLVVSLVNVWRLMGRAEGRLGQRFEDAFSPSDFGRGNG